MTDYSLHGRVADMLLELEVELRRAELWESMAPVPDALASREPFCHDTLSLTQWLQFVFIPKMARCVEQGAELPTSCAIRPLAEEVFRHEAEDRRVLTRLLGDVDELLSRSSSDV